VCRNLPFFNCRILQLKQTRRLVVVRLVIIVDDINWQDDCRVSEEMWRSGNQFRPNDPNFTYYITWWKWSGQIIFNQNDPAENIYHHYLCYRHEIFGKPSDNARWILETFGEGYTQWKDTSNLFLRRQSRDLVQISTRLILPSFKLLIDGTLLLNRIIADKVREKFNFDYTEAQIWGKIHFYVT